MSATCPAAERRIWPRIRAPYVEMTAWKASLRKVRTRARDVPAREENEGLLEL